MPLPQHSLIEYRQQREAAIAAARTIHDRAARENRDLTEAEQREYDGHTTEAARLKAHSEREERLAADESELSERAGRQTDPGQPDGGDAPPETPNSRSASFLGAPVSEGHFPAQYRGLDLPSLDDFEVRNWRSSFVPHYMNSLSQVERRALMQEIVQLRADAQRRDLQADIDVQGGFAVAPPRIAAGILKAADDRTFIRELGTIIPSGNSEGLGVVSLDQDPDDAEWTSELDTGTDDEGMKLGGRELKPKPLAKRIKISRKLLRVSTFPIEQIARQRLSYKFSVTLEKAGMVGPGSNGALGVFTNSRFGISAGRDFSDHNLPNQLTMDGWKWAKSRLKPEYRTRAVAIMHTDVVFQTWTWKDGNGRYLLQTDLKVGEPDRIDGIPLRESAFAPNVIASGNYVGIIGDMSFYWWNDSLALEFQRLNEVHAHTNQIGLIARLETDGMPVLEEAFSRLLLP